MGVSTCDDETLAPLCSLMLTFRSRSPREIALGDVLPRNKNTGGQCFSLSLSHTRTHAHACIVLTSI